MCAQLSIYIFVINGRRFLSESESIPLAEGALLGHQPPPRTLTAKPCIIHELAHYQRDCN